MRDTMTPVMQPVLPPVPFGRRPVAAGVVPVTLSSATIAADGVTLTLVFSGAVAIGLGGSGGISVKGEAPADASVTATYDSGDGSDTLIYLLDGPIYATEDVTLDYAQPGEGLESDSGGADVESVADFPVTNNSEDGDGILREGDGTPFRDENDRTIKAIDL